jgi:hypothetical protein
VVNRRGAGTLGCLFSIFVVVALGYFATQIGEAVVRRYRFEHAMRGQVLRAAELSNADIRNNLRATADSLGIPSEGLDIGVARSGGHIAIWSDYEELIELPYHVQGMSFHPHAEGPIPADTTSRRR